MAEWMEDKVYFCHKSGTQEVGLIFVWLSPGQSLISEWKYVDVKKINW